MPHSLLHTPTALVVAHPGHELLLHHLLERARPLVFVLTDGSGGHGVDRRGHSRRIIKAAGAGVGAVFGAASDKAWYQAILAGELDLFFQAKKGILSACFAAGVRRVVADPIEHFNPVHDLCAVLAGAVARDLAQACGEHVAVCDYAIEAERDHGPLDLRLQLDADALSRKMAAARTYDPLAAEVAEREASSTLASEVLRPFDPLGAWPEHPPHEPYYEAFGRRRLAEGAYDELITYAGHIRPIAMALGAGRETGDVECASPPSSPYATSAPTSATA